MRAGVARHLVPGLPGGRGALLGAPSALDHGCPVIRARAERPDLVIDDVTLPFSAVVTFVTGRGVRRVVARVADCLTQRWTGGSVLVPRDRARAVAAAAVRCGGSARLLSVEDHPAAQGGGQ